MSTYYSVDHEWITVDGDTATVGITSHAAEQMGDVVFVDLKDADDEFEKGDDIGVIESVKAASEILAPVNGVILEANGMLADTPSELNTSPEGKAWLYKIRISDASQLNDLMDADGYKALIG